MSGLFGIAARTAPTGAMASGLHALHQRSFAWREAPTNDGDSVSALDDKARTGTNIPAGTRCGAAEFQAGTIYLATKCHSNCVQAGQQVASMKILEYRGCAVMGECICEPLGQAPEHKESDGNDVWDPNREGDPTEGVAAGCPPGKVCA